MSKDQELQKKVRFSYDTPKSGTWETVTDLTSGEKEKGKKSKILNVNFATTDSGTWDVIDD